MLRDRARIWLALILRDIRSRRGRSAESFLLSLAEPVGQLLVTYLVFQALRRKPDFGDSLLLFLITGVMPYFLFTHLVGRIMSAIRVALPMLPLGAVGVIDVAIAQLVLETLIIVVVGAAVLGGDWLSGNRTASPYDTLQLTLSVLAIALLGFGVGIFNACVVLFASAYRLVWTLIARSLIFFSSVFYVVETLPPDFRDWLWWNPLLHGVIWFRVGIFEGYPTDTLSYTYMLGFALAATLLGLSLETLVRRRA
jgi:capsular polysaccharide transport system permease protein